MSFRSNVWQTMQQRGRWLMGLSVVFLVVFYLLYSVSLDSSTKEGQLKSTTKIVQALSIGASATVQRQLRLEQASVSTDCDGVPPRKIYIDAGANVGDTMLAVDEAAARAAAVSSSEWEAFSFEPAAPLVTMCETVARFHNEGKGGYAAAIKDLHFDFDKSAFYDGNHDFASGYELTKGPFEKFLRELEGRGIHAQKDMSVVKERLARARCTRGFKPPEKGRPRVTFVPAGVGSKELWTEIPWRKSNFINGGSNMKGFGGPKASHDETVTYKAPIINFAKWLVHSFRPEDFVFIKVDVEGFEYELLRDLMRSGALHLIDEMSVEWHSRMDNLVHEKESDRVLQQVLMESGIKLHGHQ